MSSGASCGKGKPPTSLVQGAGQMIVQGSKMTSKVLQKGDDAFCPFFFSLSLFFFPLSCCGQKPSRPWAEDLHSI
jgi:hypothetical protein